MRESAHEINIPEAKGATTVLRFLLGFPEQAEFVCVPVNGEANGLSYMSLTRK